MHYGISLVNDKYNMFYQPLVSCRRYVMKCCKYLRTYEDGSTCFEQYLYPAMYSSESIPEAIVASGCASSKSDPSLVVSRLLPCIHNSIYGR